MKILVIAHFQGDGSPTSIFIHAQTKAYAALGHQVRVLAPIAVGKNACIDSWSIPALPGLYRREIQDVEHVYLRFLSLSNFGEKAGLNIKSAIAVLGGNFQKLVSDFQPDIIHAHTLGFDSDIGAWMKERIQVPLVVTTHGSDTSIPYEQGKLAWLKGCADQADYVVAVSSVLADKLRASQTATPIFTILNGFRIGSLTQNPKKQGNAWLQVCNLLRQKRVDVTIRAFSAFYRAHADAVLTIVGQGSERIALEKLCRELGVENAVHFAGKLPNQDVLAEMGKARFFCMPSVREGFGIVYLEAMASGCVTVGTAGEGIADLITDGENGFLVPPDDPEAIVTVFERCLADPAMADAVAARGRDAARSLTWEKNAAQYLTLFTSLTEGNKKT